MPLLSPLLSEQKQIKKSLAKRKKKVIEKYMTGISPDIVAQKVELERHDGWRAVGNKKKNLKSVRLAKDKSLDEQLEDELWCIAAKMGFNELSDGRSFKIDVGDDKSPRQIDVFAKDGETAILIECTHSATQSKKSVESLINKIISIKSDIANSINNHYGTEPKLKIRWVIATRNIDWSDADLKKVAAAKIIPLRDQEIDYYDKLSDHLKSGAKYQFLSHLFSQEVISGLSDLEVAATRGKMGGVKYYNFIVKPSDLLKIAYVSHKASRNSADLGTYQRMLQPKRLKSIGSYIDNGGQFPTNIVVNIKDPGGLQFQASETIGDSVVGKLKLPNKYASAWVIDGQHRLYGYAYSQRAQKTDDKTTFPVLAYENLPATKESKLFVDINNEQVRVKKDLLILLYADLKWDSVDFSERLEALQSKIILSLDEMKSSPIYGRLKTAETLKSKQRHLTLTNLNDGLEDNKLLGKMEGVSFKHGPLSCQTTGEAKDTLSKATALLIGFFSIFSKELPEHWAAGDAPQGYLCTNLGIRALLRVLKSLFDHIEMKEKKNFAMYEADTILDAITPFMLPLIEYFKSVDQDTIKSFKDSSKSGVNRSSMNLMRIIHEKFSDFCPADLKKYLETIDEKGTDEARTKLDEIQITLFKVTIALLKKKHGEQGELWWWDGVPKNVRSACLDRQNDDHGAKAKEQYLDLIDYRAIAQHDWEELFKQYYSFSKDGGKDKQTDWLVKLNKIRQTTHHPEKWPASKDQVAIVRDYHGKVNLQFANVLAESGLQKI